MKFAFISLLIISFLGVAVFGFISMIYGGAHNGGCIASKRIGALCPLNNAFAFVVFHIDAFKYFSNAIFVFSLTFLLVALSLAAFSILPRPLNNDEDDDYAFRVWDREFKAFPKIKKIIRWLLLRINSPALIPAAA